jgi:hypothetical protein
LKTSGLSVGVSKMAGWDVKIHSINKQPVNGPYSPTVESLSAIPPNTRPSIPILPAGL